MTTKTIEQPAYAPPAFEQPVDLRLDRNEGPPPDGSLLAPLDGESLRRYPSAADLERDLARVCGVEQDQVLATAGGDDAIDRLCRLALAPNKTLLTHSPTFEMIPRGARRTGAALREVQWASGPFPAERMQGAVDASVGLVAIVSPNNPTGLEAPRDAIERVADAAADEGAITLLDQAYVEFTSASGVAALLERPGVAVVRTLSKAWGLAGLRVGALLASPDLIERARSVGAPYAVSGPSIAVARARLAGDPPAAYVRRVARERSALRNRLATLGAAPLPSRANFVFARFGDAGWTRDALASLGVAVRGYPDDPALADALRITCPGNGADFERLTDALEAAMRPEALLFDLDGVLADVSRSYRAAIVRTAAAFGVEVARDQIVEAKRRGGANNDWDLTRRLIREAGVEAARDEVVAAFERVYQGDGEAPGLRETERLLCDPGLLGELAERVPLAIVTGRPRADAEAFLRRHGLLDRFAALVCMEDGPAKPDPAVVRAATARLGVRRAWMVGDTVDDMRAARAAGVVPIGVTAPGEDDASAGALRRAGAARVLGDLTELKELLP